MGKASRRLYGWLAFSALMGLLFSLYLTARNIDPIVISDQTLFHQNTPGIRIVAFFSYFTIWSNLLVLYLATTLAFNRARPRFFSALFASGLLMITVSGLVYNSVLLPIYPPKGWALLSSGLLHIVVPALFIYLWSRKGPHGLIRVRETLQILLIPILYIGYTVAHGVAIQQWPYKFLDLTSEGFLVWAIGVLIIFAFGVLLITTFAKYDEKLGSLKTIEGQDQSSSAL
jgi:hypothetical protein